MRPMASHRPWIVRSAALRRWALSFESAATDDPGDHWASLFDWIEVRAVGAGTASRHRRIRWRRG